MATKTYTVHKSMHGDGVDYDPGDERTLDEIDAKPLIEMGALSLKGEAPAVPQAGVRHTFGKAETTGHLSSTIATTGRPADVVKPKATPKA